ncbi:hemin transporter [Mycetocola lacteus]|uniref:nitric oxide dioxygenase n=1 Tax=Mycetocola lacteus TaxID=76637 RepID=A0A3L7AT17_9MICO|nr:globin domain-containing protein [Mycetocola lacteus]RLP83145.1 hemin transporter [Mycetocola lacteus]
MLSATSRSAVVASLPLVRSKIEQITPIFYERMFTAHPEFLDGLFNEANHKSGIQHSAFALGFISMAARMAEDENEEVDAMLTRIAHRHTALGVSASQYDIVHDHLFEALEIVLGAEFTPELRRAWNDVYWLLSNVLLRVECDLYDAQASFARWAFWWVTGREEHGDTVFLSFEPVTDTPVSLATPGQYVSVRVATPSGRKQARQYTLISGGGTARQIAVRRNDAGLVSPVLNDTLAVGDMVELSNPYGNVVLTPSDAPLALITAGIGATPTAAIVRALAEAGSDRQVQVFHADRSPAHWALRERITEDVHSLPNATLELWFQEGGDSSNFTGDMDLTFMDIPRDAEVVLCGPLPFMQMARGQLIDQGVPARQIHYEMFGPDLWYPERG